MRAPQFAGASGAMAELKKNPLEQLIDWFSGWKASFDQLQERIGWLGAVLLLLLAIGLPSAGCLGREARREPSPATQSAGVVAQ